MIAIRAAIFTLCVSLAACVDSEPVDPSPRCEDLACRDLECDPSGVKCTCGYFLGGSHVEHFASCTMSVDGSE